MKIIFISSWIYCVYQYGYLFGFGIGWLPSLILATIVSLGLSLVFSTIVLLYDKIKYRNINHLYSNEVIENKEDSILVEAATYKIVCEKCNEKIDLIIKDSVKYNNVSFPVYCRTCKTFTRPDEKNIHMYKQEL